MPLILGLILAAFRRERSWPESFSRSVKDDQTALSLCMSASDAGSFSDAMEVEGREGLSGKGCRKPA